jgi:hypothetical protein
MWVSISAAHSLWLSNGNKSASEDGVRAGNEYWRKELQKRTKVLSLLNLLKLSAQNSGQRQTFLIPFWVRTWHSKENKFCSLLWTNPMAQWQTESTDGFHILEEKAWKFHWTCASSSSQGWEHKHSYSWITTAHSSALNRTASKQHDSSKKTDKFRSGQHLCWELLYSQYLIFQCMHIIGTQTNKQTYLTWTTNATNELAHIRSPRACHQLHLCL